MDPMVAIIRHLVYRVFAYIHDLYGAAKKAITEKAAGKSEKHQLGELMRMQIQNFGPKLKPEKCTFDAARQLEIPGSLVDPENRKLRLNPKKIVKIRYTSCRLISYSTKNRRFLKRRDVQSFTELTSEHRELHQTDRCRLRPTPTGTLWLPHSTRGGLGAREKSAAQRRRLEPQGGPLERSEGLSIRRPLRGEKINRIRECGGPGSQSSENFAHTRHVVL